MKPMYVISNKSGFVDLIIMFGIMTFATLALMSVAYQKREQLKNTDSKLAIDMLQQSYSYYVQDTESWKKTFDDPRNATTFACLKNGTACSQSFQPIAVVRNANDELVVDTDADKGVTLDGAVCTGYDTGVASCPLHVNLSWQPICNAPCINPRTIQIEVSFNRGSSFGGGFGARFVASSVANVVRKPLDEPTVTAVGVAKYATCAIADGDVYCWGSNLNGVLGPAATGDSTTPIKITGLPTGVTAIDVGLATVCAVAAGNVYCWGEYHGGSTPQIINTTGGTPLANVIKVSVGIGSSCAITLSNAAYCWGGNTYATLGYAVPATADFPVDYNTWSGINGPAFPVLGLSRGENGPDLGRVTDVSVGGRSVCAVVSGGVQCWGLNASHGGNLDASFAPYPSLAYDPNGPKGHKICYPWLPAGTPLTAIPGPYGYFMSPAGGLLPYDTLACNPKPEPTDYPILDANVKQIRVAYGSYCALFNDGDVACWGHYDNGKLARPLGSTQEPQISTVIHGIESLGSQSSGFFALKAGRLWAWGTNGANNALGDPNGGVVPPYWGRLWTPVELTGIPGTVTQFQGGSMDETYHACAVSGGRAYCWGSNSDGQLGDGTTTSRTMGNPTTVTGWP